MAPAEGRPSGGFTIGPDAPASDSLPQSVSAEVAAQLRTGDAAAAVGAAERARESYNGALRIARSSGDAAGQVVAHQRLGDSLAQQGLFAQAVTHLLQGLSLARSLPDRAPLADLLNTFSFLHWRKGDLAMALEYNDQLQTLAGELGDLRRGADALLMAGNICYTQGAIPAAIDSYAQAEALFVQLGVEDQRLRAISNLAAAHLEVADYPAAERASLIVVEAATARGDLLNVAYGRLNLAKSLCHLGRTDEALGLCLAAQRHLEGANDLLGQVGVLEALGDIYAVQGKRLGASLLYEKGLSLAKELGEVRSLVQLHRRLGDLAQRSGQVPVAKQHFAAALAGAEELGHAGLCRDLGDLLAALGGRAVSAPGAAQR